MKLEEMKDRLEQLVKYKGKKMGDRESLGKWLREKRKENEVKAAQLTEQGKQASLLQKSKLKKTSLCATHDRSKRYLPYHMCHRGYHTDRPSGGQR